MDWSMACGDSGAEAAAIEFLDRERFHMQLGIMLLIIAALTAFQLHVCLCERAKMFTERYSSRWSMIMFHFLCVL